MPRQPEERNEPPAVISPGRPIRSTLDFQNKSRRRLIRSHRSWSRDVTDAEEPPWVDTAPAEARSARRFEPPGEVAGWIGRQRNAPAAIPASFSLNRALQIIANQS